MHTLTNTNKSLCTIYVTPIRLRWYLSIICYNVRTLVEHPVDFPVSFFFSGAPFSDTQLAGRLARFHPVDVDLRPCGWNPDSEAYRGETTVSLSKAELP